MLGVTAVLLSQHTNPQARRYASVFGLAGQPFWFYSSYVTGQWGIFTLCFLYSGAWGMGFYNSWIRRK